MNDYRILIILISAFVLYQCSGSSAPDADISLQYYSFSESGCKSALEKTTSDTSIVFSWSINENVLHLNFDFSANCCSMYKDSVAYYENHLNLFLKDTTHNLCKCICPIGESFSFESHGSGQINIELYFQNYGTADYLLKYTDIIEIP